MIKIQQSHSLKTATSFCQIPEQERELENLENHPAWQGQIGIDQASELLKNTAPFSYILCPYKLHTYVLSYMRQDEMVVTHAIFHKDEEQRKWTYRNAIDHSCSTLDELVSKVMHCDPSACKPLGVVTKNLTWKA